MKPFLFLLFWSISIIHKKLYWIDYVVRISELEKQNLHFDSLDVCITDERVRNRNKKKEKDKRVKSDRSAFGSELDHSSLD